MRIRARLLQSLTLICAVIASVSPARAQVTIVSDINLADTGGGDFAGTDNLIAQGFVMPAGTDYTLSSVDLVLDKQSPINGTFTVALWDATGTGGRPGTQLLVIANQTVDSLATVEGVPAEHVFNSPSPITLTQGTAYYVVLTADKPSAGLGSSGVHWNDRLTTTPTTTGPGSMGPWTEQNPPADWLIPDPTNPFQLGVSGTPVPEPATTAVIAGLSLAAFALAREFRTRRIAA